MEFNSKSIQTAAGIDGSANGPASHPVLKTQFLGSDMICAGIPTESQGVPVLGPIDVVEIDIRPTDATAKEVDALIELGINILTARMAERAGRLKKPAKKPAKKAA